MGWLYAKQAICCELSTHHPQFRLSVRLTLLHSPDQWSWSALKICFEGPFYAGTCEACVQCKGSGGRCLSLSVLHTQLRRQVIANFPAYQAGMQ